MVSSSTTLRVGGGSADPGDDERYVLCQPQLNARRARAADGDNSPTDTHSRHASRVLAPAAAEYVPAGHGIAVAASGQNEPAGHSEATALRGGHTVKVLGEEFLSTPADCFRVMLLEELDNG